MQPFSTENYGLWKVLVKKMGSVPLLTRNVYLKNSIGLIPFVDAPHPYWELLGYEGSDPTTTALFHHICLPRPEMLGLTSGSWVYGVHLFHVSTLFSVTTKNTYAGKRGRVNEHMQSPDFSSWSFSEMHPKSQALARTYMSYLYVCYNICQNQMLWKLSLLQSCS